MAERFYNPHKCMICPVGPTGQPGEQGPIGPAGPIGERGRIGRRGPVGETGLAGNTGPLGPVGPTGATGDEGETGYLNLVRIFGFIVAIEPLTFQHLQNIFTIFSLDEGMGYSYLTGNYLFYRTGRYLIFYGGSYVSEVPLQASLTLYYNHRETGEEGTPIPNSALEIPNQRTLTGTSVIFNIYDTTDVISVVNTSGGPITFGSTPDLGKLVYYINIFRLGDI